MAYCAAVPPANPQAAVAFTPNQDLAFCASVAFVVLNLLLSTQFLGTCESPWLSGGLITRPQKRRQ